MLFWLTERSKILNFIQTNPFSARRHPVITCKETDVTKALGAASCLFSLFLWQHLIKLPLLTACFILALQVQQCLHTNTEVDRMGHSIIIGPTAEESKHNMGTFCLPDKHVYTIKHECLHKFAIRWVLQHVPSFLCFNLLL